MPRKSLKNRLARNSVLTESQLECVIDSWARGFQPKEVVSNLDENFTVPKHKQHVLALDGVAGYMRDLGDYLWITWGYKACIQLFQNLPEELQVKERFNRYPAIDEEIRQLLGFIHVGLLKEEQFSSGISQRVRIAALVLTSTSHGSKTSIASLLSHMFAAANGFSTHQTHTYLARAMALSALLESYKIDYPSPEDNVDQIAFACYELRNWVVSSLEEYPLRQPLPFWKFPWADDGWSRYQDQN